MKIPDKIKVAGHYYDVKFKDKWLSKREIVGRFDNDAKKILLCKYYKGTKRAKSEIEQTLVHEIIHSVDRHYNHSSLSEKETERLSQGLYQVLKDNFKF